MNDEFSYYYRKVIYSDALRLSVLFKQVYIQTYGIEGITTEFANFITHRFSVERIEKLIYENPDSLMVALNGDHIIGAAEIEFDKDAPVGNFTAPELSKLYVLDWFSNRGIGYGLLQQAENILQSKGYKTYWLWVLISNKRAISFYERHGFKHAGNAFFQMELNTYENTVMVKNL